MKRIIREWLETEKQKERARDKEKETARQKERKNPLKGKRWAKLIKWRSKSQELYEGYEGQ